MAQQKPSENPATTSIAYDTMAPRLARSSALLGGTDAMRAAGQDYLPIHNEETSRGWQDRLESNVLFNFYEVTLDQLAGKPFAEPLSPQDDVPEIILEHLEDIDLQGNTIDSFCQSWFRDALRAAVSCVLVDFPRVEPKIDEAGNPIERTRADDLAENLRPYWTHIKPEQILAARAERIHGVETLVHVRIAEKVTVADGFDETEIEQIRVLEPGRVELWRREDPKRDGSKWVPFDEYETSMPVVTLIPFYTDREGLMEGQPPLDDLAHLNIRHWQSMSDQIRALTVSRFPMLVLKGIFEGENSLIRVGPEQAIAVPKDGDVKWLEATGSAIEQGRNELQDLEERMTAYGAQLLKKRPGNTTATARALDSAEAMSFLQAAAVSFQSAVEQALFYHAMWLGLDDGGSVKVMTDFSGIDETNAEVLKTLRDAQATRVISTPSYIEELKRRRVLREDYDYEEDKELIEAEMDEAMARAATMDLDPAGEDTTDDEPDTSGDQIEETNE